MRGGVYAAPATAGLAATPTTVALLVGVIFKEHICLGLVSFLDVFLVQ